jgi:hypothetical protein
MPAGIYSEPAPKKPSLWDRVTARLTSAKDLHPALLLPEWIGKRLNAALGR